MNAPRERHRATRWAGEHPARRGVRGLHDGRAGSSNDYLICVSADGKQKKASPFGVRLVVFVWSLIVFGLIGVVVWLVRRRGAG